MAEPERRRRRQRHRQGRPVDGSSAHDPKPEQSAPSPADLAPSRRAEAETSPVHDPEPDQPATPSPATPSPATPSPVGRPSPGQSSPGQSSPGRPPQADDREAERGLRGLVGSGASQVGPRVAMRARDASRPSDADLAAAERDLVIIRRHWVPREELPRGGR
ncbi:MAG TPA: hypothetical protein VFT95_04375 [Micromonosporaceae bacterium]|nr:hypothetical protein [Micromonosporaceae bacterium]